MEKTTWMQSVYSKRKRQQWKQIIQDWENSGLTKVEYCQQHELSLRTFYDRLKKLRDEGENSALHKTRMEPPPSNDKILIYFHGAEMTLPAWADAEAIAGILNALRQI